MKGAIMFNKISKSSDLEYLPINLQLFGEEDVEEVSDDMDDVVDYPDEPAEGDVEEEQDEYEEVVEPQESKQTPEENAQFAKMRKKAEEQVRKKLDAERAEIERMRRELEEEQAEKRVRQEYLSQQKIWDKADEEGVSEDIARKLLEAEVDKVISTEKTKVKERYEQLQAQKARYESDPFFDEVNKKAMEAINANPSLNYDTAYKFYADDYWRGNIKAQETKAVKRTIANVQDSMRRRSVPSGGGNASNDVSILSKEGREMANAFGVDPREVAKYVKQSKNKK